jgi:hypothetical protein
VDQETSGVSGVGAGGGGQDGGARWRLGWGKSQNTPECSTTVASLQNAASVAALVGAARVCPCLQNADARWDAAAAGDGLTLLEFNKVR